MKRDAFNTFSAFFLQLSFIHLSYCLIFVLMLYPFHSTQSFTQLIKMLPKEENPKKNQSKQRQYEYDKKEKGKYS